MRKSQNKQIAGILVMLGGVLFSGYSLATSVSDVPTIFTDYRYGVGLGIFMFFVGVLILIYRLYGNFLWYEPDVELFSDSKDFFPPEYFYKTAILEIKNNEELPITKCFATIELAEDIHIDDKNSPVIFPLIPFLKPSQRIRWEESLEMDGNCEITIMGKSSKHISVGSFKNMFFYHLQEGDVENQGNFGIPVHVVKIRVDGYFNERQMKPLFFEGYVYAANLTPPDDFLYSQNRCKNKKEIVVDRIKNLKMIFESGDWMENKKVKKYMDVKEYKVG